MIEYKDYAKFENLSELSEAIEIGLDIEFILYGERYNISWRDDEPFICRCPEGETNFYTDAKAMLDKHKINDKNILFFIALISFLRKYGFLQIKKRIARHL